MDGKTVPTPKLSVAGNERVPPTIRLVFTPAIIHIFIPIKWCKSKSLYFVIHIFIPAIIYVFTLAIIHISLLLLLFLSLPLLLFISLPLL